MSKKEFVEIYAKKTELTRKKAEEYLNAFLETVEETLVKGNDVKFVGWGTFSTKLRKGRKGINSLNKKKITIPDKTVVKFKPGKNLAEKVNVKKKK